MKMRQLSKSRPGGMSLTAGQRPPKIRKVESKIGNKVDIEYCMTVIRQNNSCPPNLSKVNSLISTQELCYGDVG